MAKKTLSIMPYYGGKARMAHFIAEHINYDDSDIFVTPFGGACRVLLNKTPHRTECYNDYGSGLCELMKILSSPESATDFIHKLLKTEFSKDEFDKAKKIFDEVETDLEQQARNTLKEYLKKQKIISAQKVNRMLNQIAQDALHTEEDNEKADKEIETSVIKGLKTLSNKLAQELEFKNKFEELFNNWIALLYQKEDDGMLMRSRDHGVEYSDMELAVATYIVFTQSRDGMGKVWSDKKFRDTDHYRKHVLNLFECAKRLEGVQVYQIDAIEFFREYNFVDVNQSIDQVDPDFVIINRWINNPRVMMCCDPSYIDLREEAKALEGIDINKEDSLSDAITRLERKYPGDLGEDVYTKSFDYRAHENFLRCIQKAKCKILVCNYDLALYNKYLNEDTGWKRSEFVTSTSIGGKRNNLRVEVVWYNY